MKKVMTGFEKDRMQGWEFRVMSFIFNAVDLVKSPNRRLDTFNIQKGQTIVDWGCGTGRYLKQASELVSDKGIVYAVDIHELAVKSANKMIKKFNLKNVHPCLTDGQSVSIPTHAADVVYALDMFHMVKDTKAFLTELCRITKKDGLLYLEDGHQPRELSKEKVNNSGCWDVFEETKAYLKCKPKDRTI